MTRKQTIDGIMKRQFQIGEAFDGSLCRGDLNGFTDFELEQLIEMAEQVAAIGRRAADLVARVRAGKTIDV